MMAHQLDVFARMFQRAVSQKWSNSDGGNAQLVIMQAMCDMCNAHANPTLISSKKTENFSFVHSDACMVATPSRLNSQNSIYAGKQINPDVTENITDVLRDPKMWLEEDHGGENDWYYKHFVPHTIIEIDEKSDFIDMKSEMKGIIIGEVKSGARIHPAAETNAFMQALRGLCLSPTTAALIMTPQEAVFQCLRVENGFIDVKKKKYDLIEGYDKKETGLIPRLIPQSYETLFNDVVLYMWNSFYKDHSSILTST